MSPGHPYWDRDESQEIFRRWRRIADEYSPPGRERVFVAEAWRIRSGGLRRYVGEERLHSAFNFDFLAACWDADDIRARVDDHLIQMASAGAAPTWVLGSHDITRVATRLAADESWGQRRLSATPPEPDLTLGRRRATALAMFTFALPGAVYIYQGDELGLPEVEDLPDSALQDPIWERSGRQVRGRDGCRVPIPWTSDYPKLGFTTGTPWLPVPTDWSSLSVEEQDADHASTLATYRQALRIRRRLFEPQASDGAVVWRSTPPGVLAFDRGGARCILNTTKQAVALPPSMAVVLSSAPDAGPEQVPADACLWLEVTA